MAELRGRQGVGFGRLDAPRNTASEPIAQYDLATILVANRYHLPAHVAAVVARLAGLGEAVR